jgi:hypothetical protein
MAKASLAEEIRAFARADIRGIVQARQAAERIVRYAADPDAHDGDPQHPTFHDAFAILQAAGDEHAANELRREALPALRALFDRRYAEVKRAPADAQDPRVDHLLFALKVFALYGGDEQDERIVRAVRDRLDPDGYLWSVVFNTLARVGKEAAPIVEAIARPLPEGFLAVALLDAANQMAIANVLAAHPFDCSEGYSRLRGWLSDPDPDNASFALSATTALPFIGDTARLPLLAIADKRLEPGVRLEAAWVRVKCGDPDGVEALAQFAAEPRTASSAIRLLEELGRPDAVPAHASDPTFRAMAESIDWLSHPNEMGRPPDTIELFDHREAYWPPTDDERPLWLFRYSYDGDRQGLVMYGSTTFALFGETTTNLTPEDAYALHCCWELEVNRDPRAPKTRSARAGRKLLGW